MQNQDTPQETPESGGKDANRFGAFKAIMATVRDKAQGLYRSEKKLLEAALTARAEYREAKAKRSLPDETPTRDDPFSDGFNPASIQAQIRIEKWNETIADPGDSGHAAQRRDEALAAVPDGAVAWDGAQRPLWCEGKTKMEAYAMARDFCGRELDSYLREEAEIAKLRGIYGLQEDHDYYIAQEDPAAFGERREEIVSHLLDGASIFSLGDIPNLRDVDFAACASAFEANSHHASEKVGDFITSEIAYRKAREIEANRERPEPLKARGSEPER